MSDNVAVTTDKRGLGDFLRTVRPGFPPELMTEENYKRLEVLLDSLPPAYGLIYESWLEEAMPRIDFQCYFSHGEGLALADGVPFDSPVWQSVRELIADWSDLGTDIYDGFWLEFDLSSGGSEATPRVGFSKNDMRGGTPEIMEETFNRYLNVFRNTVRRLPGTGVPAGTEDLLRRCFEAFPDDSFLYGTGFSYMDGGLAVRWCITFSDIMSIPAYLRRIDWPGDANRLEAEMPRWPDLGFAALALDCYSGILPRVGLELSLKDSTRGDPGAWHGYLEDVASRGLMHPRWPSLLGGIHRTFRREDNPKDWPECLGAVSDLTGREASMSLYFAHVKLVFERNAFTHAKNYVYSTYGYGMNTA